MAFLTPRTKSHKSALCEHLCAQHAQHPIRVCGLCVCGVKYWVYWLNAGMLYLAQMF